MPPYLTPPAFSAAMMDAAAAEDPEAPVGPASGFLATDEWPLAEASAALGELSRELADEVIDSPGRLFGEGAAPPLPAWSDDDLLNIMPTRSLTPAHAEAVPDLFADSPTPESPAADASALAAAQALELLAQRVRNGELLLPGYDPRMGDAAALVSALAALLGIRLG